MTTVQKELNIYDILWFIVLSAVLLGALMGGLYLLPETAKIYLQEHREYLSLLIFAEQAIRILPVIILVLRKKKDDFFQSLGFKKVSFEELILYPLAALVISWGVLLLLQLLMYLYGLDAIPGLSGTQENIFEVFGKNSWSIYIVFISAAVIAPVLEEITYRGFLQQIIMKYSTPFASTLITAGIFSLAHMQLQVALPLFILGVILSTLYTKTRSIWPGIVFHVLNNTISLLALLLQ
ncbi:MAG: lysostaphin resistance A-like protein [Candidatus Gracilibacteria bacterium]